MDDRVDAPERVAQREVIGEVPERDLDPHPLLAQPARIADQAADGGAGRGQPPEQRAPDRPRGAGQEQHAGLRAGATPRAYPSLKWATLTLPPNRKAKN